MDLVPVLFGHPPFTPFYQPPCRNAAHVAALAFARHVLALVEEDYVVTAHQAVTAAALTLRFKVAGNRSVRAADQQLLTG